MSPKATISDQKKEAVEMLTEAFKSAKSVVFVNYSGLNVKLAQELRAKVKASGGTMLVAKNTLMKIAGKNAGLPESALSDEVLQGQSAVIIADEDSVSPIQEVGKFAKEYEKPEFIGGVVEGSFQDKAGLLTISTLPGREELTAQALGAISAPLYGVVGALQGNLQKLVYILSQKAKSE